jgi:hypothetical protein
VSSIVTEFHPCYPGVLTNSTNTNGGAVKKQAILQSYYANSIELIDFLKGYWMSEVHRQRFEGEQRSR